MTCTPFGITETALEAPHCSTKPASCWLGVIISLKPFRANASSFLWNPPLSELLKASMVKVVFPEFRDLSQTESPTIFPNVGVLVKRTAIPVSSYKPFEKIKSFLNALLKICNVVMSIRIGLGSDLLMNSTGY